MPRTATADRLCNLTLDRHDWEMFVRLLERTRNPIAAKARESIRTALMASRADELCVPRECEKWATVLNLVWEDAMRLSEHAKDVCHSVAIQISTAQFRG